MQRSNKPVPYFSQWESRHLTSQILAEGFASGLARDPLWRGSGARSIEEYVAWAWNICGMACLKMILAARTGQVIPTLELARACTEYGGYVIDPHTGAIKGLIYAPLVKFLQERFGIRSEVVTGIGAHQLPELLGHAEFFIASVHSSIRWPERTPPAKGGHLVLVMEAGPAGVVFHNPSGHDTASQENATVSLETFERFFAARGVAILA